MFDVYFDVVGVCFVECFVLMVCMYGLLLCFIGNIVYLLLFYVLSDEEIDMLVECML